MKCPPEMAGISHHEGDFARLQAADGVLGPRYGLGEYPDRLKLSGRDFDPDGGCDGRVAARSRFPQLFHMTQQ
jgi:hypothetical protein